ncbi:MAG: sodium:solute symporter [Chitinophagales bacterium]|nr:sodium:solute symporter [Chitinophagales bacterium]
MITTLTPGLILAITLAYFAMLVFAAWWTTRQSDNSSFFIGNHSSPWYLVAFGMIGTSLSGVTFISVPGSVGKLGSAMGSYSYIQLIMGNVVGYWTIILVLMPLYYRQRLISIYSYLEERFGFFSYKTGAFFFLLSRTIGSAFRLFLVALVLQAFVFDRLIPEGSPFQITFPFTVAFTLILIWVYTYKGGIKTIIYTDSLQTIFLVASIILSIYFIADELQVGLKGLYQTIKASPYAQMFFWDAKQENYFFKQFLSGFFIALAMVGLDQDLMQKNISCRNLKEAQLNMFSFSIIILIINILFVSLGALLYIYSAKTGIVPPARTDYLFPMLALEHFAPVVGILFLLGIIAATYASSDSALTALTTSFCIDFLNFSKRTDEPEENLKQIRHRVHLGFTFVFFLLIVAFRYLFEESVVTLIFTIAGYTYGPLLGLYAFGILTKLKPNDRWVPIICILSPILCYFLNKYSKDLFYGYEFGLTIIIANGFLTFLGLLLVSYIIPTPPAQTLKNT